MNRLKLEDTLTYCFKAGEKMQENFELTRALKMTSILSRVSGSDNARGNHK